MTFRQLSADVTGAIEMLESMEPPLQFTWKAPASGEYELYVTAVAGSGSYTLSFTIET